jgi:hypothetical protein
MVVMDTKHQNAINVAVKHIYSEKYSSDYFEQAMKSASNSSYFSRLWKPELSAAKKAYDNYMK